VGFHGTQRATLLVSYLPRRAAEVCTPTKRLKIHSTLGMMTPQSTFR
jgi:hypothetical protein